MVTCTFPARGMLSMATLQQPLCVCLRVFCPDRLAWCSCLQMERKMQKKMQDAAAKAAKAHELQARRNAKQSRQMEKRRRQVSMLV